MAATLDSDGKLFRAAANTLRASWWTLLLARLFGKKSVGYDSGMKVTMYLWRGTHYVTACRLDLLED